MMRTILAAGLLLGAIASATAQTTLRVGDQKGNSQAVMEAAGVLRDVPYKIEWKEFPAAAPLLEALSAGAIETGLVGDAPFTFAAAANVPVKAIAAIRQSRDGLAVLVPRESAVRSFEDLKGKKIATGRGSIGHQLILAALESKGWGTNDVQIVFLAPSDAKVAYTQGSVDAWSTWEPYVSQEEVLFQSRRVITAEGLTPGTRIPGRDAQCDPRQAAGTGRLPSAADGRPGLVADQCRRLRRNLGQADEHPGCGAAELVQPRQNPHRADRRWRGGRRAKDHRPVFPRRPDQAKTQRRRDRRSVVFRCHRQRCRPIAAHRKILTPPAKAAGFSPSAAYFDT